MTVVMVNPTYHIQGQTNPSIFPHHLPVGKPAKLIFNAACLSRSHFWTGISAVLLNQRMILALLTLKIVIFLFPFSMLNIKCTVLHSIYVGHVFRIKHIVIDVIYIANSFDPLLHAIVVESSDTLHDPAYPLSACVCVCVLVTQADCCPSKSVFPHTQLGSV